MSKKTKTYPDIGEVRYTKRRGQKSISMSMKPGYTRVNLPLGTPFVVAEKFVLSKTSWIQKHQVKKHALDDGAGVGKTHTLSIEPTRKKTHIKNGVIHAPDNDTLIDKAVQKALLLESNQLITPMLESLADLTGHKPSSIGYKLTRSRWGSCSSTQAITISTLLIQMPWDLIEYVLIHELCHIKQMNHSSDFWALVAEHCPQYKERKKALKQYSPQLYDTNIYSQN